MKKLLLVFTAMIISGFMFAQDCSDLFISEYVEGSGNNKAIELCNPTLDAIDLSLYQLVRYSNGGTEPAAVQLSGTIGSKEAFVVVIDKRDPDGTGYEQPVDSALQEKADIFVCPVYEINKMMYFNGNDAVTLEKTTGEIVDIFALIGPPMTGDDNGWCNLTDTTITYNSGGNPTEYTIEHYNVGPLFWLAWTKDHTLIRKPEVSYGVTENPDMDFIVDQQWDSIPENTFDSLGFHNCNCTTFGIDENQIKAEIDVFPNPVTNNKISISANQAIKQVEMFDLSGRVVERFVLNSNEQTADFDITESFKGLLFISVKLESGITKTNKILVE